MSIPMPFACDSFRTWTERCSARTSDGQEALHSSIPERSPTRDDDRPTRGRRPQRVELAFVRGLAQQIRVALARHDA
jgi:hypothetical protein